MSEKMASRLTVRLDDQTFDAVSEVADKYRVKKSEVVRLALVDNLVRVTSKKRINISSDDREFILARLQTVLKEMNDTKWQLHKLGTNHNQLVKAVNMDKKQVPQIPELNEINRMRNELTKRLDDLLDEVNDIWLLLV